MAMPIHHSMLSHRGLCSHINNLWTSIRSHRSFSSNQPNRCWTSIGSWTDDLERIFKESGACILSATLTKLRQILGVLGADVGGGGLGSEHRISWGQVCLLLEPQEALHCRGWYVSGKALQNPWDQPALGTCPFKCLGQAKSWDRPCKGTWWWTFFIYFTCKD